MTTRTKVLLLAALAAIAVACGGCAAGSERFVAQDAGFWMGLWHGLIIIITFIISLFSDTVRIYESHNTGALYDLGYVIGVMIALGGSCRQTLRTRRKKRQREKEWEEIAERVEKKVRKGVKAWLDETEKEDREWEEIASKIEARIKRELSDWGDE
jgi:hypothetical protein